MMPTYEENLVEARALGAILPCDWTPEQRERVIELTGMTAAAVDEIIAVSRIINRQPEYTGAPRDGLEIKP